jgi:hypothetical protein
MLTAVFRGHTGYVVFSLVVVLAAGAVCYLASSRLAWRRPWSCAALGCAVAAELCLTLWSTGSGMAGRCVVNRDLAEPFLTAQGWWNAVMFLPVGLFGMLAVRRPAPVLVGVVSLTVATEIAQGVLPVGRGCDTADVEMNTIGGLLGLAAGWLVLRTLRWPVRPWRASASGSVAVLACVVLVSAVMWGLRITATVVDATSLRFATAAQQAAAEQAVQRAFGDRYTVANVQSSPDSGQLFIALDGGFASLSWPDARRFSASLVATPTDRYRAFPVPGVDAPPRDASDALAIARRYAADRYAWALRGSEAEVSAVDTGKGPGWLVSWRRVRGGIVMPMRLDVRVAPSGRITELSFHRAADPGKLPEATLSAQDAERALRTHLTQASSRPEASAVDVHELTAVEREGRWRVEWIATVERFDAYFAVDASTGTVHENVDAQPEAS